MLGGVYFAILVGVVATVVGQSQLPNIIFILIDDLGWNDIGYHGSEIMVSPFVSITVCLFHSIVHLDRRKFLPLQHRHHTSTLWQLRELNWRDTSHNHCAVLPEHSTSLADTR